VPHTSYEYTDQVNRLLAAVPLMRPARRLPINGHDLPRQAGHQRTHPSEKALPELCAVEGREDPANCVVRSNAVLDFDKGSRILSKKSRAR
jgi:hypothetical protein